MRNCARLLVVVFLLAVLASAQSAAPKGEVFGGYSFIRQHILQDLNPIGLDHVNGNGWMAGAAGYFSDWLGVKGEVNGVYANPGFNIAGFNAISLDESLYTYTFGPVVSYRKSVGFQPFGHALFGGATVKTGTSSILSAIVGSQSATASAFAMQFGGGVDVPLGRSVAVRGQADFIQSRFDTLVEKHQNHFKASAALVFRFGGQ